MLTCPMCLMELGVRHVIFTSAVNEAHCRIIPLAEMDMLIFTPQKVYLPLMIQGGSRWIPKETWVEELNSH